MAKELSSVFFFPVLFPLSTRLPSSNVDVTFTCKLDFQQATYAVAVDLEGGSLKNTEDIPEEHISAAFF